MSLIMYVGALEHVFPYRDEVTNRDGHAILEIVGNCRLRVWPQKAGCRGGQRSMPAARRPTHTLYYVRLHYPRQIEGGLTRRTSLDRSGHLCAGDRFARRAGRNGGRIH